MRIVHFLFVKSALKFIAFCLAFDDVHRLNLLICRFDLIAQRVTDDGDTHKISLLF